jgi:phosphate starvation-inducible membrane PsiE
MARFERKIITLGRKREYIPDTVGALLVNAFHYLALFGIGSTIVWFATMDFLDMALAGGASVKDILLLFIYLELGAMVGIYFKTRHLPVRFLIYVAITALVRTLFDDVQPTQEPSIDILYVAGAILMLALASLIVRYSSFRFSNPTSRSGSKSE